MPNLKIILEKKFIFFLLIFAAFYSLLHSIHWIIPYIGNGDIFIPIKQGSIVIERGGDDYFYYTLVRDIIDGNILFSDPVNVEFKNIYSIYNTYNFSVLMGAFGGLFFENINTIYSFNYFLFPFLNFIIIGLFTRLFIKEIHINILIVTLVVFFTSPLNAHTFNQFLDVIKYFFLFFSDFIQTANLLTANNQLYRFPTLLTTNIHLFFTFWILLKFYTESNKTSLFIFCSLLLGISSFVSVQNFIILYSFIFFIFLIEFKSTHLRKAFFYLAIFSTFLSLPGIILISETILKLDIFPSLVVEHEYFNPVENPSYHKQFNLIAFITRSLKYLALIAFIYFFDLKNRKVLISILLSVFVPFLILNLFLGDHYGFRIFNRGGSLIVASVFFISIFNFLLKIKFFENIFVRKYSYAPIYIFIFLINFYVLNFELKTVSKNLQSFYDSDFTELYSWINSNTKKDDTFVTMDPDLIINLPIYSRANMYLPHSILSRSNLRDRITRVIQVSKYYGIENEKIFDLLTNLEHESKKSVLFGHIIYHFDEKLKTEAVKNQTIISFIKKGILNDDKPYLKYDHDYLLVSQFDKNHINNKNLIKNYLIDERMVFKNESFKLYKLQN